MKARFQNTAQVEQFLMRVLRQEGARFNIVLLEQMYWNGKTAKITDSRKKYFK